jgi:hypothetical protein
MTEAGVQDVIDSLVRTVGVQAKHGFKGKFEGER